MSVLDLTKTDNKAFPVKPADLVYLNLTIKHITHVVRVQYNIPISSFFLVLFV